MSKSVLIGIVVILVLGAIFYFNSMKSSGNSSLYGNTPTSSATPSSSTIPSAMPSNSANPTNSPAGSTQTSAKNAVQIANYSFSPASLTVKVGDSVTWTNGDSLGHSATADDGSFDTGVLSSGQSGSTTFSKAGTYTYHCSVHPSMKGTIVVQ